MSATSEQAVLVSGATGGIGGAVVQELAREPGAVVLLGRSQQKLDIARKVIEARGDCHATLATRVTDISSEDSVNAVVSELASTFGGIRGIVHTAGDGPVASLAEATDQMWHTAFDSKLMGAVHLAKAAARPMAESGGGSIVLVSGVFRKEPDPLCVVNSAVNAALAAFGKAVSRDLGTSQIRVTVVDPGATDTPLWADIARDLGRRAGRNADEISAAVAAQTPLGSLNKPSDIASVIRFLLSPEATRITGTSITVDGGACAAL